MKISNHDSLSSSETRVNRGMRSWSTYLLELDFRNPLVASISQRSEELRLYKLVQNLTISDPNLLSLIIFMIHPWVPLQQYSRGPINSSVETGLLTLLIRRYKCSLVLQAHLMRQWGHSQVSLHGQHQATEWRGLPWQGDCLFIVDSSHSFRSTLSAFPWK